MATRDEYLAAVRLRCALPPTDPAIIDADIESFINQAIQRISYAADWAWLEALDTIALTASDNTYAFSFDTVRRWISFSNQFGQTLEERPVGDVIAMQKFMGDGVPMYVGFEGPTVYFAPGSSGSQNVEGVYVGYEAELTAGTSAPLMPAAYDDAVIWYAAHLVYAHRRLPDESTTALAQHKDALADMIRTAPLRARSIGGGEPQVVASAGE